MRVLLVCLLFLPLAVAHHPGSVMAPPGDALVHRVTDVETQFKEWDATYPELVDIQVLGTSGVLDLPLWNIRITDESVPYDGAATATGEKVRIYIDGGHHGNEFMGTDLPMYYMRTLLADAETDADVQAWLQTHELWSTPLVNPEGNGLDTRKSGSQVDLNRNYPFDFGGASSSSDIWALNYRGTAPLSEPETAANAALALELMPDVWITGHSGTAEFLYPWGWIVEASPDDAFFKAMEEPFEAATNGAINMKMSAELYPAGGATDDWGYGQLGIPTHTYEVHGDQFIPAYGETVPVAIQDQLGGLDFVVKNARLWGAWISMHDQDGDLHVWNEGWAKAGNITLTYGGKTQVIEALEPGEMWTTPLADGEAVIQYKQMLVDAPDAKVREVRYTPSTSLHAADDAEASGFAWFLAIAAVAIALTKRR